MNLDTQLSQDIQKVFKVIESCENEHHINGASKFIQLFTNKWEKLLPKNYFKRHYTPFLEELLTHKQHNLHI